MDNLEHFADIIPIIEKKLAYTFTNKALLTQAFIHRSFLNEVQDQDIQCNERLEFLGDSVLHLFVSHLLFTMYPNEPEGILSKIKAHLIAQKTCSDLMESLELNNYILVAKGQKILTGKPRITLTSDLFEALLGAVFLDGGWQAVEHFFHTHFIDHVRALADSPPQNAKAELQEIIAKKGLPPPKYILEKQTGPAHQREFTITVYIQNEKFGEAHGLSKREAEQIAAGQALKKLFAI